MDVQTAADMPQLVNAFGTYILEEGLRAADLADPLERDHRGAQPQETRRAVPDMRACIERQRAERARAGTATLYLNPRNPTVATLASAVSTLSMAASPY